MIFLLWYFYYDIFIMIFLLCYYFFI
jgi:hypothetical protein